ncbi:SURP and G-patch domain-containing protein 2-like isoform X2 [Rhineura floridana]|uniref:SURP and G-patch domain-containing protein 2-like isoform X2 n=1 Tax=Rhineura floridana TaxID=261503 RepID=UPI002AC7FE46|nr:SURP and G-patch domain-containing protein 2-like isoform X2 [Rhineura floridana]
MATRRMTRESFDALMQVKAKRYRLDRSDPIDEALHQLRVHSHPAPRARYEDKGEDFQDDGKYVRSDWREGAREAPREDYSVLPYRSASHVTEEKEEEEDYYTQLSAQTQDYVQPSSRKRDYGSSSSVERDYTGPSTRERDYGNPASRKRDFDRVPSREPSRLHDVNRRRQNSGKVLGDFRSPGLLEEEFGAVQRHDYDQEYRLEPEREFISSLHAGRDLRGKRSMASQGMVKNKMDTGSPVKKWGAQSLSPTDDLLRDPINHSKRRTVPSQRPQLSQRPHLPPQRGTLQYRNLNLTKYTQGKEVNLELTGPSDIFTTFGVEIIKWAGFNEIRKDPEYSELYRVLFTLETETCAKMLASFKCLLKAEHQDFCFSVVRSLQHAALRTPKVDNQFLNLLLEKKVVKTKNCFFEVIKPFDWYMMRLQDYLLKSTTPLLMACNAYELSIKSSSFNEPGQMAAAFETTVSLCRKSLALLGQTFALASEFRHEKILEAIGLQEAAPKPTMFPNFDTSALFGREYIEHLQSWLEKSGYQMQLKRPAAETQAPGQRGVPETRPKIKIPQRADRKVTETIEKLVNSIISGMLTGRGRAELKGNPEYWFLYEEESLEHKYYKLKLAEMKRLMSTVKEEPKEEKSPEQRASDAVRALLYARKVASVKKKLFRRRRPGILQRAMAARKARRATVGTQTLLSAGTVLKQQQPPQSPTAASAEPSLDKAGACDSATDPEEAPGEVLGAASSPGLPGDPQPLVCQFPDVDPKTMVTAERLAKFVAEVGPEIEQFSIDNSADNPDLWFLHDRESSAFKFYRLKVYELCPSISFSDVQESTGERPEPMEGGWENLEEEEEEEEEALQSGAEEEEEEGGATVSEEGPARAEASSASEEGQPGSAPTGMSAQVLPQGTPFGRKRISSKSLKVGLIPASKRVCLINEPKVHDPIRISYDRPGGRQSFANKKKSKNLEFSHKKLSQRNVGFQMLQKMGWREGRGLGVRSQGIKDPVKVGSTSGGEGLGAAGDENKEDTFATFRQRMIQMYYLKRASK